MMADFVLFIFSFLPKPRYRGAFLFSADSARYCFSGAAKETLILSDLFPMRLLK
jgi:hypothetical protein